MRVPIWQVAGIAQKLEHFAARGVDFNALDVEHAHVGLLARRHALSGPFDDGATTGVMAGIDGENTDPIQSLVLLTSRIDLDLAEAAHRLAPEFGESVSQALGQFAVPEQE